MKSHILSSAKVSLGLSVHLPKHNIQSSNNSHNVSKHVVLADMIDQGKMEESWSLDLASVRSGRSIRDEIHSKLSLWCFNSSVGSSSRDSESLGEEFKVVNKSFHRVLHLSSVRRYTLGIVSPDLPSRHVIQTLLYDPQTLSHLCHPHQVSVIAVSSGTNRHIKVHQVISIIGLGLPQVILDTSAPEHDTTAPIVYSVFCRDHSDINSPLLPQSVVSDQVLNLV